MFLQESLNVKPNIIYKSVFEVKNMRKLSSDFDLNYCNEA